MKQFRTIFHFELGNYFKSKVFIGITLVAMLAIAGLLSYPRIAEALRTEDDAETKSSRMLLVAAENEREMLLSAFQAGFENCDVSLCEEGIDAARERLMRAEADSVLEFESLQSVTYYVDNLSMTDMTPQTAYEILRQLNQVQAMLRGGMTLEQVDEAMNTEISFRTEALGKDQGMSFLYTYLMIMLLYMTIMLYGVMVCNSVASEKSSRAMELLVTSAKPTAMMFGKVLAAGFSGLVQIVLFFGTAILFYNINRGYLNINRGYLDESGVLTALFDIPGSMLAYMLVFYILGFLFYAFLYGAVGSMATRLEDTGTLSMPLQFLMMFSMFVNIYGTTSGKVDGALMRVCSYLPFSSSMAMIARIGMSSVPVWEIALSLAILLLCTLGTGIVGAKIYRVGVLLYGTPPKPSAIIKALRHG